MQVRGGERLSVRRAPEGAQTRQLLPQPRLHAAQEAPGTGSFICSETWVGLTFEQSFATADSYREVHLHLTPEIEVFHMLFQIYHSKIEILRSVP